LLQLGADGRIVPNAAGGEVANMLNTISLKVWRFWLDNKGQDLVEYALAAAFVAVTASAFFPPAIAPSISSIFSKIVDAFGNQP
jgi:pilus assembly protein Flp/PilA